MKEEVGKGILPFEELIILNESFLEWGEWEIKQAIYKVNNCLGDINHGLAIAEFGDEEKGEEEESKEEDFKADENQAEVNQEFLNTFNQNVSDLIIRTVPRFVTLD